MDRETLARLRLDRRLIRRRGWISEGDLAKELAKLPDAAGKAVPLGEPAPSGAPERQPGPAEESPDS